MARPVLVGSAAAVLSKGTAALSEVFRSLTDPVPPEFVRAFQESTLYHPVPEVFLETVVAQSLKLSAHVWRDTWAGFVGLDHTARLASLTVPTLIVRGGQGGIFSRKDHEHLAATLPQATLKVYTETGHAPHWERSEQFVEDLKGFLKGV